MAGGGAQDGRPTDGGIEIWGGVEATIARIGDDWRDQVFETGHQDRPDDLDRIADLGITAVRYPVLWESLDPRHPHHRGWDWHDARIARLQALGVRPILGLVHHGSGPAGTDLLDPAFGDKLALHADAVARRYPDITDYTPVNEPLTTARFSALYGHWYPHGRDHGLFLKAVFNQCRAVILSMRAIRAVNPAARLVQTEDLGKVFARPGVPDLAFQAEFENERRFLSFDLLCGRVGPGHPLFRDLGAAGVAERDLAVFRDGDGRPDVFGMNHYLTSERFLDDRLDLYPAHFHGGNGRTAYADVEAVRAGLPDDDVGPKARLRDLWERYRGPVAITEAHHGCSREEQIRWLRDCHTGAMALKAEGADVRAITVWALFGVVDWSSLLTRRNGHYEPGAFDVRHDPPRPTAIARHVRRLTGREREDHATLTGEGWWRRASRFYAHVRPDGTPAPRAAETRRLLLVGSGRSAVGRGIAEICEIRGLDHAWSVGRDNLAGEIEAGRAWAVVDIRPPLAARQGVSGERLADLCRTRRIPYLLFSSEKVFDGSLGRPYVESDPVAPGCETGHQLADLERRALSAHPEGLVVRAGPVLTDAGTTAPGHLDGAPVLDAALHGASAPALIPLTTSCFSYLPDLVHAALDLLVDGADGLWHLVNDDEDDWDDVVRRTMGRVGVTLDDDGASRLADGRVVLRSERARVMPARESALGRYLAKHRLVL